MTTLQMALVVKQALTAITVFGPLLMAMIVLVGWIIGFYTPSPVSVFLLVIMFCVTGFGITIGYHRMATHNGFKTSNRFKILLLIGGSMAGQGSPRWWIQNHLKHHAFSDMEGDPHSPIYGFPYQLLGRIQGLIHSHFGWFFARDKMGDILSSKAIDSDPQIKWVSDRIVLWVGLSAAIPLFIGGLTGLISGGLDG